MWPPPSGKEYPPHLSVPDVHTMVQKTINHDSPTTSGALRSSARISSTTEATTLDRDATIPQFLLADPIIKLYAISNYFYN